MNRNTATVLSTLAIAALVAVFLLADVAYAAPGGATIVSNSTDGAPVRAPQSRQDPRGTITTMVLSSVQQDDFWKAYVGNITGRLSLDSADGFTIYDWPLSLTKNGEVYISRANSINWSGVTCATQATIYAEEGYHGMTGIQSDNVNKTFNATNSHQSILIGSATGTVTISANSCRSIATYLGGTNASQTLDGTQKFQEILLQDTANSTIFTTIINATTTGYDSRTYDFQAIVPDAGFYNTTATVYYFYTELG